MKKFGPHQFVPDNAEKYLAHLKPRHDLQFLEIGTLEGRSACWFLDNFDCHLVTIDPCLYYPIGWEDHDKPIKERVLENLKEYGDRVTFINTWSHQTVPGLPNDFFDFIYIDGDHCRDAVYLDGCLCWPKLKVKGIMIFDDYMWNYKPDGNNISCPHDGIDLFIDKHNPRILATNFQMVLEKWI